MKFALGILVYLIMAFVLGAGIFMMIIGKPWLLIGALVVYIVAFAKIGCLSH